METRDLSGIPSLLPLYAKAAVGRVIPGRSSTLPDRELRVNGVGIEPGRVDDYSEVCGFRRDDGLPPTYPHILAFPVSMELMTARTFPFPLLGLVHVGNRIELLRPIRRNERLDLRVRAEDLRPHRRGRQFDMVAEAEVGGEPVWRSRSIYLRPGKGGGEGGSGSGSGGGAGDQGPESPQEPAPIADPHGGEVWEVPGDIGRRYAAVSGDRNPIHMHDLSARAFGFPGAIAHGMWMKARCLAALEPRLPRSFSAEVEFRAPLRIPGSARLVTDESDGARRFALEPLDGGRPHLTGTVGAL